MGILANIGIAQTSGVNCSHDEWKDLVRRATQGVVQDEEEWGRLNGSWWDELRREFPQLTVREFVSACGQLAAQVAETGR